MQRLAGALEPPELDGVVAQLQEVPRTRPVVMGGHVREVARIDSSGKELWSVRAQVGAIPTAPTEKNGVVYVCSGKGIVSAIAADSGKLLWQKDLGIQNAGWFFDPDSEWGVGSSPVLYKNSVIVLCDRQKDSFIAAFDLKDGRELWRTARAELPTWGTPAVAIGGPRSGSGAMSARAVEAASTNARQASVIR